MIEENLRKMNHNTQSIKYMPSEHSFWPPGDSKRRFIRFFVFHSVNSKLEMSTNERFSAGLLLGPLGGLNPQVRRGLFVMSIVKPADFEEKGRSRYFGPPYIVCLRQTCVCCTGMKFDRLFNSFHFKLICFVLNRPIYGAAGKLVS